MVDPCGQPRQFIGNHVQLDFVKRARACGRAEEDLATGISAPFRDPCRIIKQMRQLLQRGNLLSEDRPLACRSRQAGGLSPRLRPLHQGLEGRHAGRARLHRQRDRRQFRVGLKGNRLIVPIEKMRTLADVFPGVFGEVVVIPCCAGVTVTHGRFPSVSG